MRFVGKAKGSAPILESRLYANSDCGEKYRRSRSKIVKHMNEQMLIHIQTIPVALSNSNDEI